VRRPFRLSVTGHRLNQLPEAQRPAIRAAIQAALGETLHAVQGRAGAVAPILVSALAEGADRFAAAAALEQGWRLEAPLPFAIDRYERDFGDAASIGEFQGFLKRADKVSPIDGEALIASGAGEAAPYAAVGRALLIGAHALLAVWNGAPKRGPGGTAEVVENALEQGTAVLWIRPEDVRVAVLSPSRKARSGSLRRAAADALSAAFAPVAFPISAVA